MLEGEASTAQAELPFELQTVPGAAAAWGSEAPIESHGDELGPVQAEDGARSGNALRRAAGRATLRVRGPVSRLRWHVDWNRRARSALPTADLYLVHSFFLAPAVLWMRPWRSGGVMAYDSHDAYFEIRPGQKHRLSAGERAWRRVERACVKRSAGISTVSEGLAGMLEERFSRRPVVIRNCHDLRLDTACEREIRQVSGVSNEDFLVVSVGNDKDGMTIAEAISALVQLPESVHLAVVGRGHERHRPRIFELGLEGRVHLTGPVPPTQVADFISRADAALVPYYAITRNYAYALPNGFFQALGAGLPVLYAAELLEVAALAERHRVGIAIDARAPDSVAEGIAELQRNPGARARFRANARRAGVAESWEREEARLEDYVGSLLERRGLPSSS